MSDKLREALQCAEYALSHPKSNQVFALNAVRDALDAESQPAPSLSAEQVREAMRKAARQGFGCSYYDEDRLTAELNALLAAAYTMPSGHGAWCAATGDSTAKCSCGLEQREAEIRNAALENVAKIFSGSMRAWTPFEIIERILALKVASRKPDPMDGSRETDSAGERT